MTALHELDATDQAALLRRREVSAVELATHHLERAEARGVTRTPTVVVLDDGGAVVVQAEGVPPLPRLLAALASAAD